MSLLGMPGTDRAQSFRGSMSLRSPKAKGTRNERHSIRPLEAAGYHRRARRRRFWAAGHHRHRQHGRVPVQVKTRELPSLVEMETSLFPAPANVRKLVHRWAGPAENP
jgi:hypothetical protein